MLNFAPVIEAVVKAVTHEPAGQTEVNPATGKTVHGGQFAPTGDSTKVEIASLLPWGAAKRVTTSQGERDLQTAQPDQGFWQLWRTHKDALKAAGISAGRDSNGEWVINWWRDIPKKEILAQRKQAEHAEETRELSRATDYDGDFPVPENLKRAGYDFFGYQKAGIAYGMKHNDVLIGDDMGLGKTLQAIGIVNADKTAKRVLIVCPASLKINWQREYYKWSTKDLSIGISGDRLPRTDVVIVNYDVLAKFRPQLEKMKWDVIIADEIHYAKSETAQRSVALLGNGLSKKNSKGVEPVAPIEARRRIFMTGTPIVNRPEELWNIVRSLDPTGLGANKYKFLRRYAGGAQTPYGFNSKGASNLDELQDLMRERFMVRRRKADVLKDLPAKMRTIVTLDPPDTETQGLIESQNEEYEKNIRKVIEGRMAKIEAAKEKMTPEEYDKAVDDLMGYKAPGFEQMSKIRHELAFKKMPQVVAFVKEMMESGEKVIVFAHHKDVVAGLMQGLKQFNPVKVVGGMTVEARTAMVDKFQDDPECKVFVGNIKAAGVGLTLTASSNVVMAELDWSPANVTQAEDRAHRYGQKDTVNVYHLVYDDSLDSHMAKMIMNKQRIADAALDDITDTKGSRLPAPELPSAKPTVIDAPNRQADIAVSDTPHTSPQDVKETPVPMVPTMPVLTFTDKQKELLRSHLQRLLDTTHFNPKGFMEDDSSGFAGSTLESGKRLLYGEKWAQADAQRANAIVRFHKKQVGASFDDDGRIVDPDAPKPEAPAPVKTFADTKKEKTKAAPVKRKPETITIKPVAPISPSAPTPFIGKVGEKAEMHLKVDSIREYYHQYGTTYHYNFTDPEGRAVHWSSSKLLALPHVKDPHNPWLEPRVKEGDYIKVSAKVMDHSVNTYRNVPETKIGYGKILSVSDEPIQKSIGEVVGMIVEARLEAAKV